MWLSMKLAGTRETYLGKYVLLNFEVFLFKELRQVKSTDECTVARLPENRDKNRFRNILPCE